MLEETDQDTLHGGRKKPPVNRSWVWDVLLIGILLISAYLRFTGINWDANQHLHPDERFLTMVETSLTPVKDLAEYFDSARSSMNPNNHGFTFYVYGTLPIFLVRYVGEWIGQTGYDQINIVGRVLSGIFDLGTIVFIYLIGKRIYRHPRLGLLAALFSGLAVLQIQLSHYFTVDNFANFFTYGAIYCAVCISTQNHQSENKPDTQAERENKSRVPAWLTTGWRWSVPYLLFGLLYGMALASKLSIWALAVLLPLAGLLAYLKTPSENRETSVPLIIRNLAVAGILAFLTFRFFQPYSFMGPGFFGLKLNPGWLSSMRELSTLMKGDVDVPYALQWARRPDTFTIQNLVLWGLGIPLGVLSLVGLLWMTWRMIKGDWQKHVLIWSWTVFVLVNQSLTFVKSMRYIISIYPALALIAAWTIFKLFEKAGVSGVKLKSIPFNWRRMLAVSVTTLTIISTFLWAFAFLSIYQKPVTRVAASDWIYENIPAAINLHIEGADGQKITQPVAYQNTAVISAETPYTYHFTIDQPAQLSVVEVENVLSQSSDTGLVSILATVYKINGEARTISGAGFLQSEFRGTSDSRGDLASIILDQPALLETGAQYLLELSVAESDVFLRIGGGVSLKLDQEELLLPSPVYKLTQNSPFQVNFVPRATGEFSALTLHRVVDLAGTNEDSVLTALLMDPNDPQQILASGEIIANFKPQDDPRGESATIQLDKPVNLDDTHMYTLVLTVSGKAELGIYNSVTVLESTWDDALPVGLHGFNQFGYWDGIYGNNLNLELYWDDNQAKLDRLETMLNRGDAIFMSSNRQWGTIPRVPERYPLTTEFYRALIGCPENEDILKCFAIAEPGRYQGELGYELTAVFQNDPAIGNLRINDQRAEEAFTVYDHPKVLIFTKSADYDPARVERILGAVDLTTAVHKTPLQATRIGGNLRLSADASAIQTSGGTWVKLFPPDSLLNRLPWLAAVTWYLVILLLGWIIYPITRFFLAGLPDRGYTFSRLIGILVVAYLAWLAGSIGFSFSRLTISILLVLLLLINGLIFVRKRTDILDEVKKNRRLILTAELVMLAFFLVDLAIRIGNPDLWHPWKGGEKPMDLSYFTAVLKSTTFPPYDPWYSGGYINYYYYGFVVVGVLVKWLGIQPAVAYNLIIPTLFALTGLGAFGIGWNLFSRRDTTDTEDDPQSRIAGKRSLFAGLASAVGVLIAGNLGTIRIFWLGLQRLGSPDGLIDNARFFQPIGWFFAGLGRFITGSKLSVGMGEWYWNPSRAIPGDVITEFPFFTFTYADLHAHMIALPITLLVLGWAVSVLFRKWQPFTDKPWKDWISLAGPILFGGFVIATLRPTNTWDLPTYLLFGIIVLLYTVIRYAELPTNFFAGLSGWLRKLIFALLLVGILVAAVQVFYLPFSQHYGQAYGALDPWKGAHSPLKDYLVHWGWQLFLITTWFAWETREWLAATPSSVVPKIKPYLGYLQLVLFLLLLVMILLTLLGINIGWIVGILGAWALVLLLRKDQPDAKRFILFMIGTGLVLTLFVELFTLQGDIGRMNTVFKFYYQAWTLLSLGAGAALIWLLPPVTTAWKSGVATAWQVILVLLLSGALLYPVTASADKIRDRMSDEAPAGLNGDAYMLTSTYNDMGVDLDLSRDYQAIQWMRMNVKGSPVIVEANTVEYRWGNRFTINTGLPGVLGWNWHQRQQRGFLDYNGITNRLNEIPLFYQTTSVEEALSFIDRYNVKYIIVGQLERVYYPGEGLNKFEKYNGVYWKEVFRLQDTVIYEVIARDGDS